MRLSKILFLLFSSLLGIFTGCTPAYKKMQPTKGDVRCLEKFKPAFTVALYNTQVDVVGRHLSGLLLIKKMPDSTTRMVFSNEVGFKFFDFEFSPNGGFHVYSAIKQLNKKAVLKTLRNDFNLILMQKLDTAAVAYYKNNHYLYHILPATRGYNYYITDSTATQLIRMERASNRKTVVEAVMLHYNNGIPDSINIAHQTFQFTIALKRIEK
jgi:hypothetical protein